ncbi:hypothetical protein CIL05_16065 [Virgibacillus profundi]|uniref:Protein-glutamine gamma-glutamyltransferase-like C-terminal domain-containing protein n=1 Tax=Virgibacillus profundi TaxID=2024555 RepID=A0A2A2IBK3_9BACI|nr:DUF4129 domain-containing protein [Virgibacillus profundi]PAV28453.1 hypothetical protein CIL05_16065 [Virgibacillus profundi]PXY52626.1 DUF4129 domain-containing protein [Virgibacillus profundi]
MENPVKAKEDLQEILNQREYQIYYEDNRNFLEIWWDNIKAWFRDLLADWLSGFEPSNGFADTLLIILIGVVFLLAIFGIFLVLRSVKRKKALQEHQPFQSLNEMEWSVERHLKEAEKQEQAENYSLATRHQFLAVLLYFHERQWLQAHVWKTNWDYFAELQRKDKQRAEAFYELARMFDEAVYGKRKIEQKEYQNYREKALKWLGETDEKEIKEI